MVGLNSVETQVVVGLNSVENLVVVGHSRFLVGTRSLVLVVVANDQVGCKVDEPLDMVVAWRSVLVGFDGGSGFGFGYDFDIVRNMHHKLDTNQVSHNNRNHRHRNSSNYTIDIIITTIN